MKDIFEGQPLSKEAPQGLRNKVEFEARQPQKASWFNGGFKWATAGTAVAAAVVAGFMVMTPATAKSWDDVQEAYDGVRSALIQINFQEDGASEQIIVAMKGDRFRVSVGGDLDMSFNKNEMLLYKAGDDSATLMQFDGIPMPFSMEQMAQKLVSHLSMTNLLKQKEGELGKHNVEISNVYQKNDRSVYDVSISDIDGGGQAYVIVDADSDLPLELRIEEYENGKLVTKAEMSFRFNEDVDDSLLEFALPSGVKTEVINMADMMNGRGEGFDIDFGWFGDDDDDDDDDDEVEIIESTKEEVIITGAVAS